MTPEPNVCRWYDETSGIKRACDAGLIDRKWLDDYCHSGGRNCVRKRRLERDGCVPPDCVLPDGTVSDALQGKVL